MCKNQNEDKNDMVDWYGDCNYDDDDSYNDDDVDCWCE